MRKLKLAAEAAPTPPTALAALPALLAAPQESPFLDQPESWRRAARDGLEEVARALRAAGWAASVGSSAAAGLSVTLSCRRPDGTRGPTIATFASRRNATVGVQADVGEVVVTEPVPVHAPSVSAFAEAAALALLRAEAAVASLRADAAKLAAVTRGGAPSPVAPNWAERRRLEAEAAKAKA